MTDEEIIKKLNAASGMMYHQWHYGYAEALDEAVVRLKRLTAQVVELEETVAVLAEGIEKYKEKYGAIYEHERLVKVAEAFYDGFEQGIKAENVRQDIVEKLKGVLINGQE